MNKLLPLLLITYSTSLAQEVKLKTKDRDESYEEYFVLADDKKVKHGSYLKVTKPMLGVFGNNYFATIGNYNMGRKDGAWEEYYPNCNQIEYRGYYKEGKKDSLWLYFYPDKDIKEIREIATEAGTSVEIIDINDRISAQGYYKADKKVGVWEFYSTDQKLLQQFDFDSNKLLYHSEYKSLKNKPLTYIGGDYEMNRHFYKLFSFQDIMDRINNKLGLESGIITIEFEVDKMGNVFNKQVVQDNLGNRKLLEHSLLFIDKLKNCWSPKLVDDLPQDAKAKIHFKLDVEKTHESYIYERWSGGRTLMDFDIKIELENML